MLAFQEFPGGCFDLEMLFDSVNEDFNSEVLAACSDFIRRHRYIEVYRGIGKNVIVCRV